MVLHSLKLLFSNVDRNREASFLPQLTALYRPLLLAAAASLVVKIYPERVLASQGGSVTLRCQVSGSPPHYFYWSREDGRPISSTADRRKQGTSRTFTFITLCV